MRFITLALKTLLRFQHNRVQTLCVIVSSLKQNISLNPTSMREQAVFFRKVGDRLTAQSSANEIAAVPHPSLADGVKVSRPLLMLKTPVCPESSFSITNLNICHWLNQYQQVTQPHLIIRTSAMISDTVFTSWWEHHVELLKFHLKEIYVMFCVLKQTKMHTAEIH